MATRNLTKKFVDLRNASKANRSLNIGGNDSGFDSYSDREHLKPGNSSGWKSDPTSSWQALKANSLPPRWVEDIEKVEDDISKIELKIKELGTLHTKRLMVNFDTSEEEKEHQINMKTKEITDIFHHAEMLLKKFSKDDGQVAQDSEIKVKTNIQRSIAKRLQSLSMSFRRSQKEYMGRLKNQKAEASGIGILDLEDQKPQSGNDFIDSGFTERQIALVDDTAAMVEQRDAEIQHIAKSIEELAQIFKELAVLVIDQGTILDRIDFNMETAVEHAKEGVVNLEKAEETQKANPAMKCIGVLVLFIVILLIVIIAKHSK